jgi:Asp/Glu/hydantoin racemase
VRLLYQSFGQEEGMGAYRQALTGLIARSVSEGTVVTLGGLPSALVEGKGYASAHALDLPALMTGVAAAVEDGADGVAIGNGFDPGLWECRELFDIPVLGLFETVSSYGLRAGWRLGVLCSGQSGPPRIMELASRYGTAGRMALPRAAGITVPDVLSGFTDAAAADRIADAAEEAATQLRQDGADILMVASGVLDTLLQAKGVTALAGLPLLPGVQILLRELEAAVLLARAGAPVVSRAGRFRRPPEQVLRALRDLHKRK